MRSVIYIVERMSSHRYRGVFRDHIALLLVVLVINDAAERL